MKPRPRHLIHAQRGLSSFLPLLFGLCLFLPVGCGVKTEPLPPDQVRPAPINDLTYNLSERGVELSWSVPTRSTAGERLNYRIGEFELYRAVLAPEEYRAGEPPQFGPPQLIVNQAPDRGRMAYRELVLRPGQRYLYQVKSRAGWLLRSEASNLISFVWQTPPPPPRQLVAEAADGRIILRWQPPEDWPVTDALHYQLYRSPDGERFSPLGPLQSAATYLDHGLVAGRRYFYQLRAVLVAEESRIGGVPGPVVSAVPLDLTPTAPPRLVALVPGSAGIRLLWEAAADHNLAELLVQRRIEGESEWRQIGQVAAAALSFVDTRPPAPPAAWHYRLIAVDRSGNRSPPGNELAYSGQH